MLLDLECGCVWLSPAQKKAETSRKNNKLKLNISHTNPTLIYMGNMCYYIAPLSLFSTLLSLYFVFLALYSTYSK